MIPASFIRESGLPDEVKNYLVLAGCPHDLPRDTLVPTGIVLGFWTWLALGRLSFMPLIARNLVVQELLPALKETAAEWHIKPPPDPGFMIVIAEARYVTWTGRVGYFDIQTGSTTTDPGDITVSSLAFNLGNLFRKKYPPKR